MLFAKPFHKGETIIEEGFIQFWMGPTFWIALDIVMGKTVVACQVLAEGAFARGGYARQQYDGLLRNHETHSFHHQGPNYCIAKQSAFNDALPISERSQALACFFDAQPRSGRLRFFS